MKSSVNLLNALDMKGLEVKEILRKNGYTLQKVAEKIGESSQNFSSLLAKDDIRTGLVERISTATGIPLAELYGIEAHSEQSSRTFEGRIAELQAIIASQQETIAQLSSSISKLIK